MNDLVVVKLGGSLITNKRRHRTVRRAELSRLAGEIAALTRRFGFPMLLGHGSGSFGHVAAAESGVHDGMAGRRARVGVSQTQAAAAELHAIVMSALRDAGVAAYSVAPSSAIVARGPGLRPSVHLEPVLRALDSGLLPVTYGDIVMDRQRGCSICSTEMALLAFVRSLRSSNRRVSDAIWLGDTDGILDAAGVSVTRVRLRDARRVRRLVSGAAATDVTGGMRHRFEAALALARIGVRSYLLDGRRPGILRRALRGTAVPGTIVER